MGLIELILGGADLWLLTDEETYGSGSGSGDGVGNGNGYGDGSGYGDRYGSGFSVITEEREEYGWN